MLRVLIDDIDLPTEHQRAASALVLRGEVDVIEAASGADAADQLRAAEFDVLIIDGDLRPKGGFSWLYELRAQAEMQGTRRPSAVVMTARDQDQFLADWSGAEAVVSKPVDGFRMADVVAALAGTAPAPA